MVQGVRTTLFSYAIKSMAAEDLRAPINQDLLEKGRQTPGSSVD